MGCLVALHRGLQPAGLLDESHVPAQHEEQEGHHVDHHVPRKGHTHVHHDRQHSVELLAVSHKPAQHEEREGHH
eukprot:14448848-Alexandrium_andersonii.AAC.1